MEFWKKKFRIPFGDGLGASLHNFGKLSFLKRLNPSFLSKVMAI